MVLKNKGNSMKDTKKNKTEDESVKTKKFTFSDFNASNKTDDDIIYTKEENKAALLAQIEDIEKAYKLNEITFKDKTSLISAIRFRLQDKFELERSDKERRIIVVPAKHLFICPYSHKECSNMPPKEVCMEYYNLVENKEDKK